MSHIKEKVQSALGISKKGETVLITGGSGFVAAHVLNSFLSRGYQVRTTVRSEATVEKVKKAHEQYLNQLSFAIVKDITVPGAFDEAVKGIDGVIHTASPFQLSVKDNVKDLLEPAIRGTTEILVAIQKNNPNVKRVVITSSFASLIDLSQGDRPGYVYTEKDWNPITYEEAAKPETNGAVAYCASKVLAEKAAFEYVEKNKPNFSITTICPPMVFGPAVHTITDISQLNTSSADIYRFTNGSQKKIPGTQFRAFCDPRDSGEAHALAYENPEAANERFAVTGGGYNYIQVCDIIRKHFPEKSALVPTELEAEEPQDTYRLSNEKARKVLGMEFRDLETSIRDQVQEFLALEKRLQAQAGKA